MQDIHNIIPPVQVGFDPAIFKIISIIAGVIVLLILLFFLIKNRGKKQQRINGLKFLPEPLSAYEAALKQLDLLLQSSVHNTRLFYFDLSAILRNFIGGSFNINAIEMTSQEFIKKIHFIDIDNKIKKDISNFFLFSDSFKYAGIIPQKDQVDKDLLIIKNLICEIEKSLCKQKEEQEQNNSKKQRKKI
jgi:hypothetical protein